MFPRSSYLSPPAGEPESTEAIVLLDDHQLASRLSYLLWSAPPDAELAALADKSELHKLEILRAQVNRLLKDARSRALFDGFGTQWLRLERVGRAGVRPENISRHDAGPADCDDERSRLFLEAS